MNSPALHQFITVYWPHIFGVCSIAGATIATAHAILHKRSTQSASAWVGVVWLLPAVGSILYLLFGINRIHRKAKIIKGWRNSVPDRRPHMPEIRSDLLAFFPRENLWHPLVHLGGRVSSRPLLSGNSVVPLYNGDEAYPKMLSAIRAATKTITLTSYIFDYDRAGKQFIEALGNAVDRGVKVRVLLDDIGIRYSWPSALKELRRRKVTTARFLRTMRPWTLPHINLRKHSKILIVDGIHGFTGGMNIREAHVLAYDTSCPTQDLHFEVDGPVVTQLQTIFAADWAFTTREYLSGPEWFPLLDAKGDIFARTITDGPDENLDELPLLLLGAIGAARNSIRIMTPYFIPETSLMSALGVAALRGVEVDIILPEKNNILAAHWASRAHMHPVLEHGCRVWYQPPPFNHSKLMVVDEEWVMFGSANWDARSLRLNFELNVECYSKTLGKQMTDFFVAIREKSKRYTLIDWELRPLPVKLRDGIFRLFAPYL
jgi:cardiolipin synthase A/B